MSTDGRAGQISDRMSRVPGRLRTWRPRQVWRGRRVSAPSGRTASGRRHSEVVPSRDISPEPKCPASRPAVEITHRCRLRSHHLVGPAVGAMTAQPITATISAATAMRNVPVIVASVASRPRCRTPSGAPFEPETVDVTGRVRSDPRSSGVRPSDLENLAGPGPGPSESIHSATTIFVTHEIRYTASLSRT